MSIGIYAIHNIISNKYYIGSSQCIRRRWNEHKSLLNRNKHGNQHLQYSYNKYGLDVFEFIILEECNINELLQREDYYRMEYSKLYELYDIEIKSGAPMKGRKHSLKTKLKMSKSHTIRQNGGDPTKKISRPCELCNLEFITYKCRMKDGRRGRFCSKNCQNNWQKGRIICLQK